MSPDYQRHYAWGENECRTLWDDIFSFCISDEGKNDKKKYYQGFANAKGQIKEGTGIVELLDLIADSIDFTETDILCRYNIMMDTFIDYFKSKELLQ